MIELVKEILSHSIEEVIASSLSLKLLKVYSTLYLNGRQPRLCAGCQRDYYIQLSKNGLLKAKQMENIKDRTCKPAWKGLKYIPPTGRHWNDKLITDAEANKLLRAGHLKEEDFHKLPDNYKSKEVEEEVMPKPEETPAEKKAEKYVKITYTSTEPEKPEKKPAKKK